MAIMTDGFSTTIDLTSAGVTFNERTVQPPGLAGGDKIDISTMRNTKYRTAAPRTLVEVTDSSLVVTYDPAVIDVIITAINTNQLITIAFPDTSQIAFWGYLSSFEPSTLEEGAQPEATITLVATNSNDSDVETAPNFLAIGS